MGTAFTIVLFFKEYCNADTLIQFDQAKNST